MDEERTLIKFLGSGVWEGLVKEWIDVMSLNRFNM